METLHVIDTRYENLHPENFKLETAGHALQVVVLLDVAALPYTVPLREMRRGLFVQNKNNTMIQDTTPENQSYPNAY